MNYKSITLSSGHGKFVSGCVGNGLEEHEQAVRVVNTVAKYIKQLGCTCSTFHDTKTTNQSANLNAIVKAHNATNRQVDISVHFNSASVSATGTEVLYISDSMQDEAAELSAVIAKSLGLKNRGAKKRTNLRFLKGTEKPALLIEICFLSNTNDVKAYKANFDKLCKSIATCLTGKAFPKPESKPATSLNQGTTKVKVTSAHIGTFTNRKAINIYDGTGKAKRKLYSGIWKVYEAKNGMLRVGNDEWVNKIDGTFTQRTLKNTLQLNVFSKPAIAKANYIKKLATGTWKVYEVNVAQQMAKVSTGQWVQINVIGVTLS